VVDLYLEGKQSGGRRFCEESPTGSQVRVGGGALEELAMNSALVMMLRKRLRATWLWQALFVLAVIGGFVSHHLTVIEMMGRIRFAAMDSRDTFYLANLGNFETAQHIHEELAKMAAETIFSRNPDGFDYPERLERLFNPATTTALNKDAARDADVFRSQQIHQKLETGSPTTIDILDVSRLTAAVDTLTKRCEGVSQTIAIVESLTRTRLRWALTIAFGAGLVTIPVLDVFVGWLRGLLH